ncbi:nucleotidyltransferase domain-containing protein [Desulfovibrio sp. OttesenSCG-928-I05]|nr:nucleotidyltransferase domain-containing protein [Desulfovibrio sp. OttesenSCG-928-I05]
MITVQSWMQEAVALLREQFGPRLLFVGLQGSHRRGEAREDSDIDILTVLDRLDVDDLNAYRAVLRQLPEGEKAGGFTCGREELLAWPAFELFQFAQDTDAYYGELAPLLPGVTREDTVAGARAAVSGLYHYTVYLYLSGDPATRADDLKGLYKSFFFAMQLVTYLRSGVYATSKRDLLPLLAGDEAELLRCGMDAARYEEYKQNDPDTLFRLLLDWTGSVLRELAV